MANKRDFHFTDDDLYHLRSKVQVRKRLNQQKKHFVDNNASTITERAEDPKEVNDVMEFWKHTTLSGVTQIGTRSDPRWKLFWIVVSVAGLVMSLYQSRYVITDYIDGRTIQIIDYKNVRRVPFPSFTVCSNVRLHHSKLTSELREKLCNGVSSRSCFRISRSQDTSVDEEERKSMETLLRLQAKFTSEERTELFYGNHSFLKNCYWKGFECQRSDPDEIMFFSSLLQGQCFTINLGINKQIVGADHRGFEQLETTMKIFYMK